MPPGTILSDYDESASNVIGASSGASTAAGVALVAMSDTVHVIIGSLLIGWGIFLFLWVKTHRIDPGEVRRRLGWLEARQQQGGSSGGGGGGSPGSGGAGSGDQSTGG